MNTIDKSSIAKGRSFVVVDDLSIPRDDLLDTCSETKDESSR